MVMKKNDIVTVLVFIFLIVGIIYVLGVNINKNKKSENVDRKIEYIMGYTSNEVLNKGESLFLQTVRLFNNEAFEYVLDLRERKRHYSINQVNNYLKLLNFSVATNNLSSKAVNEFMKYKEIIFFEHSYYMVDNIVNDIDYVGSMIDIEKYDEEKVYFKTINYFCSDLEYQGIVYEPLVCEKSEEGMFTMVLENNIFRIDDIETFKTMYE